MMNYVQIQRSSYEFLRNQYHMTKTFIFITFSNVYNGTPSSSSSSSFAGQSPHPSCSSFIYMNALYHSIEVNICLAKDIYNISFRKNKKNSLNWIFPDSNVVMTRSIIFLPFFSLLPLKGYWHHITIHFVSFRTPPIHSGYTTGDFQPNFDFCSIHFTN